MRNAAFSLALLSIGASLTVPLTLSLLWVPLADAAPTASPLLPQEKKSQEDEKKDAAKEALRAAKEVRAKLKTALKSKDASVRSAAVLEAGETVHPEVIDGLEDALGDKDPMVVRTTLNTLGLMPHEAAIKPLTSFLRREKKALKEDPELHVSALRALGRRAGEPEVKVLLDGAFEGPYEQGARNVVRARLFGAARTRSRAALEEILAGLRKTSQRNLRTRMDEARTALIWLTGKDLGKSPEAWAAWWSEAEATFEIPDETPKMNEARANAWRGFWGEERRYGRQKKRGDRG